jgi:hypothetical protein
MIDARMFTFSTRTNIWIKVFYNVMHLSYFFINEIIILQIKIYKVL